MRAAVEASEKQAGAGARPETQALGRRSGHGVGRAGWEQPEVIRGSLMSPAEGQRPMEAVTSLSREVPHGIFYSPDDIALALVRWGIRNCDDTVLDPSFGGCVFLRASLDHLEGLSSPRAACQVFGADADMGAWPDAARLIRRGADPQQFRIADFLSLTPHNYRHSFNVIVGNPPYVRPHVLGDAALAVARAAIPASLHLSAAANYWAYFVLHALRFLSPRGRIAMILPGSLLRADYAMTVREQLQRSFRRVVVLELVEKAFADVDERIVLLLGEDYGAGPGDVLVGEISRSSLDFEVAAKRSRRVDDTLGVDWEKAFVQANTRELLDSIGERIGRLTCAAEARIGVVTGANRFFLVDEDARRRWRIEDSTLHGVIFRTSSLRGLQVTPKDVADSRVKLFVPPSANLPPGAARYVRHGEKTGVSSGYKCSLRSPWFLTRGTEPPGGFLSALSWEGPRLSLNTAAVACTNTLHAVEFNGLDAAARTELCAGMVTTVAQLSAELEGRPCGGGLLKLEPSDAKRLIVPRVRLTRGELRSLDNLLRAESWAEARAFVDVKLGDLIRPDQLASLDDALSKARARRKGRKSCADR